MAHNIEDASGNGTHSDAYGYREASSSGFFTIMAYRLANSSQSGIDYLGNPAVNYAATNRPTGRPPPATDAACSCRCRWSHSSAPPRQSWKPCSATASSSP